jgi:hypothetical protein
VVVLDVTLLWVGSNRNEENPIDGMVGWAVECCVYFVFDGIKKWAPM